MPQFVEILQGLRHARHARHEAFVFQVAKDSFLLLCEDDLWLHQGRLSRLFEQKGPAANALIRKLRSGGVSKLQVETK